MGWPLWELLSSTASVQCSSNLTPTWIPIIQWSSQVMICNWDIVFNMWEITFGLRSVETFLQTYQLNESRFGHLCAWYVVINSSPSGAAYMRRWTGFSIGSGNGWMPLRRQAITWTKAHLSLIGPSRTNLNGTELKFVRKGQIANWMDIQFF